MKSERSVRGAIIDIGSNSIKFLMGEQIGHSLKILIEKAMVTRLAEGLMESQILAPASIQRSLDALQWMRDQCKRNAISHIVPLATSAVRSCRNPEALTQPAANILGAQVRVISGEEEGQLVFCGVNSNPRWTNQSVAVLDIGGGSVELVVGRGKNIQSSQSKPLGCVRIKERWPTSHPIPLTLLEEWKHQLREEILDLAPSSQVVRCRALGSGGTFSALALLKLNPSPMPSFDQIEGTLLKRSEIDQMLNYLASLTLDEIDQIPCLPKGRADIITAGALIASSFLEAYDLSSIECSTRGLRYGAWMKWISGQPFSEIMRDDTL